MKVRKNARWLTNDERTNFLKAVVTLKAIQEHRGARTMRLYDFYPLEHRLVRNRFRRSDDAPMGDGGHSGPAFPSWHREWLNRFEEDLRTVDSSVTLPYWDLTDRKHSTDVIFTADFMGGNGGGADGKIHDGVFRETVPASDRPAWWPNDDSGPLQGFVVDQGLTTFSTHPFNSQLPLFNVTGLTRDFGDFDTLPSRQSIRNLLGSTPFIGRIGFWPAMEGRAYHAPGHNLVGGLMSAPPTSPNDPIFFLHHCGVDLIWALWQARNDQTKAENLPPSRSLIPRPPFSYGHFLEDFMWPWDGDGTTNPEKARGPLQTDFPPSDPNVPPPVFPLHAFLRTVDPADVVRVGDVIDHHNLRDGTGYQYDVEIPFDIDKDGVGLARIEPYFGDLLLTGTVRTNATGSPAMADLAWEQDGTVRGWIEAATGDLHVRGQVIEAETDFTDTALQGAIALRHFNQPLAYLDPAGSFHLKGSVMPRQPAIA